MTTEVNKCSKSLFSRLLATENITVIHDKNASTASFNLKDRVLRLPIFKEMSNELYDMLVGHEVAHALFTPYTKEDEVSLKTHGVLASAVKIAGTTDKNVTKTAHGYLNVVEDARIERMIKDKFAGIRRDFFIGYKELHQKDFFGIKNTDINSMPFIDRLNLYFKIGSLVNIKFNDEELDLVQLVEETRTFDDVVEVTTKIWNYCKKQNSSSNSTPTQVINEVAISSDLTGDESATNEENCEGASNGTSGEWHSYAAPACLTQAHFETSLDSLKNKYSQNYQYYSVPSFNFDKGIVDYKKVASLFETVASSNTNAYSAVETHAKKFVTESNRVVNILAQEFMTKKAARDHHRNSVSRTGVIDPVRMTNYKFSDDIFKRMKVVQKGKSHGLVFFLDMSGSMSPILEDTIKQMVQLVLFCKRVNIPFEVYGFTTRFEDGLEMSFDDISGDDYYERSWKRVKNSYDVSGWFVNPFRLVNLISSKMTKQEFDIAIRNCFAIFMYYSNGIKYTVPPIPPLMFLSSTPLIETIVAAMDIVPKFKHDNRLDIVNSIFLTDGEATGVRFYDNTVIVKNGISYKMNGNKPEDSMIQVFRDYTGTKAISFFVSEYKTSVPARLVCGPNSTDDEGELYKSKVNQYVKEGFTVPVNGSHAYDEKFIICGNNVVENSCLEDLLSERKTNSGIRNSFIKAMTKNVTSRVMLNRFIDIIATD
jgi:hypothetical protein